MSTDIRETLDTKRFGFVKRESYSREVWHIVQCPPTANAVSFASTGPALCGARPWWDDWSGVCGWVFGKVCTRCQRAYGRQESQV